MQTRLTKLSIFALLGLLALTSGCGRKGNEGSGDATPAPEVVMPETAQPTAVESAPTLTPSVPEPAPAVTPTPPAAGDATAAGAAAPAAMPTAADAAAAMPPPTDPLLSVAQGKAAAIDAGIAGYTMRSQPQVFGDVRSDVSVYTSAGQIVMVEEKLTTSDNSISTNRYYFDGGSLFYYHDDGRWLDLAPPKPLVTRNTQRSMAFTATGKLITGAKTVDGAPATLGEYEAVAVLARAQQLLGPTAGEATRTEKPDAATAPKPVADKAKPEKVAKPEQKTEKAEQPPAQAAAPKPVTDGERVTAGRNSTLRGVAPVHGTRDFVVQAKAGQLLTLSLEGAPSAVFAVYSSRGEIVSDLTNWSSKLPRDGDYTIKVGQKGGSAPADFSLRLTLE